MDIDPPAYGRLNADGTWATGEEEEDYPYLHPPAYGHPDGGERPPFVLIEPYAYFADRENATTASCDMKDLGGTLSVTFCVAHPPRVSYLCVQATAFDHTEFAVEPHIMATDGGLLLLRLVIGSHPSFLMIHSERQYFMYDASVPSLEHLPNPGYDHMFNDHSIAIVRNCNRGNQGTSHDCDYVLAAQSPGFGYAKYSQLILYNSHTKAWSKVPLVPKSYPSHTTGKTLTVGGDKGTVAWIDLCRNIVLCDVFDKCPMLRTLQLPTDALVSDNPRSVRDIALLGGVIKYVELDCRCVEESLLGDSSSNLYAWKVAVWSINTGSSSSDDWHMDYLLNSTEIPQPSLRLDEGTAQPTLWTLRIGQPHLSLEDDDIVYFVTNIDYRDKTHILCMLAVDMRNKTVQKVDEFSSRRIAHLQNGYTASMISKYLKGAKQNTKRPGMPFFRSSSKKHLGNSMVINLGGA
ncbi:unnamed protein product [Alopecurus aequalis]